jgi:uncharacterized membrane protein YgdD (TMEM256/DUF423 family)
MTATVRKVAGMGAALAFLAVALGAFGAHALKTRITPEMLTVYQTGVQYHLAHALAILLVAALGERVLPERSVKRVSGLMAMGILFFSGSLYALALSGVKVLGAITPFGGVCFLSAWAIFAAIAFRSGAPPRS